MKKILCILMLPALFALLLTGCTKYDDTYGFMAKIDNSVSYSDMQFGPDGYSVTISCRVELTGNAEIVESGFVYRVTDGYTTGGTDVTVPGTVEDGIMSSALQGLPYDKNINVRPYVITTEGETSDSSSYLQTSVFFSKDDVLLEADISTLDFEMIAPGQVRVAVSCRKKSDYSPGEIVSAHIGLGDVVQPAEIADTSLSAVFDLNEFPVGTYDGVRIMIENKVGGEEQTVTGNYEWTVKAPVNAYSDDGAYEDCIRLCGIDWAKGNLQSLDENNVVIASQQWGLLDEPYTTGFYNEYFSWGDISARAYGVPHLNYNGATVNYKGNPGEDIVTAYLGSGWATPDMEDWKTLLANASMQCIRINDTDGQEVKGLLLWGARNGKIVSSRVEMTTSIPLDDIQNAGYLFLPAQGYYYYLYGRRDMELGAYRISSLDSEYGGECQVFLFGTDDGLTGIAGVIDDAFITKDEHQFMVRPVKTGN